jgi:hypothetical protein
VQFVVYTGDSVRHDRDERMARTRMEVEEGNRMVVQWFVDEFVKKGIAVVSVQNFRDENLAIIGT